MFLMQTQDSVENLGLVLKELYDSLEVKSVIDADSVLPLLLIADKYNIKTIVSRCTMWLDSLDIDRLRGTLLTASPVKGEGMLHEVTEHACGPGKLCAIWPIVFRGKSC